VIRVAVLGAGHWGPNLIRNFHNRTSSAVAWVIDRDATRLAQVQARFPDVRVSADVEAALADSSVAAVVVATPTSTHYPLSRAALERDKHVLVEKPLATRSEHGAELCEIAATRGRVLMVGHVFLYNAAVRRVKQYLDEGRLGRVYYVSMVRTNLGPIRVDVNAAWDLASHDISIVNYWLEASPVSVSAAGGNWINQGVEDAVFATFTYPGDVLVNLHVSWLSPRKAREITVVGEQRMLTFDDMNLNEPVRIYDKHVTEARTVIGYVDSFASFRSSVRDGDIVIPRVAINEPLRAQCDHFMECIERGTAPLTGGAEGLSVVRALEAMARSVKSGGGRELL
jgi:predicted dehydrogenase